MGFNCWGSVDKGAAEARGNKESWNLPSTDNVTSSHSFHLLDKRADGVSDDVARLVGDKQENYIPTTNQLVDMVSKFGNVPRMTCCFYSKVGSVTEAPGIIKSWYCENIQSRHELETLSRTRGCEIPLPLTALSTANY